MSKNKKWDELPEHSYERYVAHGESHGYKHHFSREEWGRNMGWGSTLVDAKVTPRPKYAIPQTQPTTNSTLRSNFLDEVKTMVCKDRAATHGDAEDNFNKIAALWNLFLGERLVTPLTSKDVAAFMVMVKLSRLTTTPSHIDHWYDIAGYAACGGGIVMKENKK